MLAKGARLRVVSRPSTPHLVGYQARPVKLTTTRGDDHILFFNPKEEAPSDYVLFLDSGTAVLLASMFCTFMYHDLYAYHGRFC